MIRQTSSFARSRRGGTYLYLYLSMWWFKFVFVNMMICICIWQHDSLYLYLSTWQGSLQGVGEGVLATRLALSLSGQLEKNKRDKAVIWFCKIFGKLYFRKTNIARIANAVQCHSWLSGNKYCHEFRFSIVRIVISVSNVTNPFYHSFKVFFNRGVFGQVSQSDIFINNL